MTTFRWYLLGLGLLFAAYVAVEYYRPKPLDWSPTLRNDHKSPYGTFVLFDQLPTVLGVPAGEVRIVRAPIFSQIEGLDEDDFAAKQAEAPDSVARNEATATDSANTVPAAPTARGPVRPRQPATSAGADTATDDADYAAGLAAGHFEPATYLFVAQSFKLSRLDCRALLRHVARGNDVLIAAEEFDSHFADTLGFRSALSAQALPLRAARPDAPGQPTTDSVGLQLTSPALARQAGASFRLPARAALTRLLPDAALSGRATQLATATNDGQAVLLRVPHGRGHLYLCSVPLAFSNYFVLQPRTTNFAFAALSYLPTGRTVWWDEYQKQGRRGEQSLLRVLLDHEALRYATYLALVGALLFVLVEARRRQRVIPVLRPLPNTTLQFTRTVAGLYRQRGSHGLIAEKKIGLFLEHLRTRYHEPGLDLSDDATRERLAQKSGIPRPDIDALVRRLNFALTAPQVSDAELLALSKAINTFRQEAA